MIVIPIVEGHGEVSALPELLRRLNAWIAPTKYVEVASPIRTQRAKFLNDMEVFEKLVQLAIYKAGADGWVLIMMDADDDCPVTLSDQIYSMVSQKGGQAKISVVIPNREFEAWFIASAQSLEGVRSFHVEPRVAIADPDQPRDAKGWLARQMSAGYHEVADQAAFAAVMSLEQAWQGSRSFRRLCAEYSRFASALR